MSNSWAFNQLNLLTPSPGTSPVNGTSSDSDRNEFSLSFPVDGTALQGQLEAWTSVNFGSAFGGNSDGLPELPETYKGLGPNDDLQQLLEGNLLGVGNFDLYGGALNHHQHAHHHGFNPLNDGLQFPSTTTIAPPAPTPATSTTPAVVAPSTTTATTKKASAATNAKKRRQSSSVGSDTPAVSVAATAAATTAEGDDDAANAIAVEEDKRRRNTAASARFRIKKKQREAALESTAKELRDKVQQLEAEVEGLKTENGWLRSLIVDKADLAKIKDEESLIGGANKRARIENDGESGPEQESAAVVV